MISIEMDFRSVLRTFKTQQEPFLALWIPHAKHPVILKGRRGFVTCMGENKR